MSEPSELVNISVDLAVGDANVAVIPVDELVPLIAEAKELKSFTSVTLALKVEPTLEEPYNVNDTVPACESAPKVAALVALAVIPILAAAVLIT